MDTVVIPTKTTGNTAQLPVYSSELAAGADLRANIGEPIEIFPHETVMVPTGIAISIPDGFFGAIYARSGLGIKENLRPANCVGVIDADYTGELIVALHNDGNVPRTIEPEQRIAQLVIQPYVHATFKIVDNLAETERGEGGFGSTGR